MRDYASLSYWANALSDACHACGDDYVVSFLRDHDLTTARGVRDLAATAIAELQNNRTPTAHSAVNLWQLSQCLKKFRFGCTATVKDMQAKWIERNSACSTSSSGPLWVFDEMRKLLAPLGPAFEAVEDQGRFGNGAVYEHDTAIARWNRIQRFSYNVRCPDDTSEWCPSSSDTARLHCVPKDMFKLRSITVEPAEATFLQQYYRARLIAAAARTLPRNSAIPQQLFGAGPEVQRRRALAGSLSGRTATLDLSDASDSIRADDVYRVFPISITAALERARTPYVEINGTRYRCHMFAGMGNATTFIVETLYFWALFTVLSHWVRDFTPVSVFGDDIVIGIRAANHPLVREVVREVGLTLNFEKSGCSEGPGFREACGLAAYQGVELPLLRVQGWRCNKPEEQVSMCDFFNLAFEPDSRYAPFFREAAVRAAMDFREDYQVPLLPMRPERSGLYIVDPSERIGEWSYRSRWDPQIQHAQVKIQVLETAPGKTVRVSDLTSAEALGVLNGQLHTSFNGAPVGTPAARRSTFVLPSEAHRLASRWVTVWGSDPDFADLSGKA